MTKILFSLLMLLSSEMYAQTPADVHMINMSSSLHFVILFYVITFVSMSLMMLKLLRPKFPSYWLYISCIVGIIGGAVVTLAFDDIQNKQLPRIEYSDVEDHKMSPQMKEQLSMRRREVENQKYANFWIISIPNIIFLGIGIFSDFNNRKRDLNKPRSRYD